MTYFVTGATGFIGRHLVEELLERDGEICVLVREGSQQRLDDLIASWELSHPGAEERITKVVGDLGLAQLGVEAGWVDDRKGKIDHFFHLAAIYDMTAGDEVNERMNVSGTRNAVALANALEFGHLHHTSSIAVAGDFKGLFREDMFAEDQKLPSAYHRTKYESEALVRKEATVPWRVYRPAVVVGHSETGEMDKIDGPYYFFQAIQKLRDTLPQWVPLVGPELGWTNIVPVDYVAAAMAHIAHQPDLDGEAFHLTHPKGIRSGEVINAFARAAHAPQMALRIDKKLTDALPKGAISMILKLPQLKGVRNSVLSEFGIPGEVMEHVGFPTKFDTRDTERALRGTDIAVPEL
ncbi:MAG: SDR family oxidoreductase, partial [Thermoleophilaceae bacterium]